MKTRFSVIPIARPGLVSGCLPAAFTASLLLLAAPGPAAERHILRTQVAETVAHLRLLGRLPATNRLQLAIGLPLRNRDTLTNLFQQLYDPRSTHFHRYLTPGQFAEQFGPTEEDYQKVIAFARTSGFEITGTYGNRALLDVAGKVSDIERAFQVTLGAYRHPTENRQFFAPDIEPSVDAALPVLYISGMDNYVIPRPGSLHARAPAGQTPHPMAGSAPDGASYWGLDFRHAYVPGTSLTGAGQVLGVVEFDGYTPGDIQAYESLSGLPGSVPLQNVLMDSVTNVPGPNNSEVALDIELAIAMAPGLLKVVVYEGASDVDIMNEIANPTQSEPLPNQISCSWGISGDPNIVPALIQMALQGQSFFYASGDHGAYPNGTDNTTQQSMNYMTAVGGTHLTMQGKGVSYVSETVWNNDPNDASAGGVLTAVPIPDFQKPVDMSRNQGSTQHRNIPDVAISADNVYFVATVLNTNGTPPVTGRPFDEQGTSGAAPLWAGFAALVNEQAAAQGKPPVGFLNPAIYTIAEGALYASCFHDITNGNNITPTSGNLYSAAPGYDLCTGWGSPTGATLINALVGLSGPVFVDFNYTGFIADGSYDFPFSTLAGGINAVSPGGTIFIKTAGSSSETMTISKPMTITASDGAATIGH